MGKVRVGGIYVVQAIKGDQIEHWAAATIREKAVAAVENELGSGWIVMLSDRRLTGQRLSKLRMTPNSVQKLRGQLGAGHSKRGNPDVRAFHRESNLG
jgi:hypothetical protein